MAMCTVSPIRMIEPLPNCFSIWLSATPSALSCSSVICLSLCLPLLDLFVALETTLRKGCISRAP